MCEKCEWKNKHHNNNDYHDNGCNDFKKCNEHQKCFYKTIYRPVRVKYVITTKKFEERIHPCQGKSYTHAYNKCHNKCDYSNEHNNNKW